MENQIVLAMDDEHNKFVEPDLDAINGEVPDEEEEEEEEEEQVDEYDRRQYPSHQQGVQSLDKVDNEGYNVEQSGHHGRDSSEGKLFVGGISWETTEETFSNYFRKYGEIADSVIMMDKITGRPRGFGFVTFADPEDADKVLEKEHIIDGRTVEVKRTVPREDMQQQQQVNKGVTKTKKIFVGGIPPSFTEDEMKEYFSSYGSIVEHQIMLDHSTGRSRGFGFVTFETEDAVERVFVDGQRHELGGKQVEIKRAEPKRSEGGSGGSAQRSSYGGGGGGFRSSGAGYGGRNASRGGYGGAKGRGYGGGGGGYDNYDSYDSYGGNYGGGAAGFYGGYGAGGYGYGFGGSMYGAPGGYPGYGVVPGYGAGRGYGAGVGGGVGGYGAGRGYGSSDGGYGVGRGYSGGVDGGYGAGRGYGGGFEGGYGSGGGYGSTEGDYGNSRGYDSSSTSGGGSRGRGGGYGGGRGYGSAASGGTGSTRYHPYQRQ